MKISNRTWHYRLLSFMGMCPHWWRDQTDLCTYMRRLAGAFALIILALAGIAAYIPGWYLIVQHKTAANLLQAAIAVLWTLDNVALMLFVIVVIVALLSALTDKLQERSLKLAPRPPGLVRTYLKALKERMCPIVEYTKEQP